MNKIRVIWKGKSGSNHGYVRLSFRKEGKTILKSIGIDGVERKYFNSKEQRLRKSHPKHEELNEIIETKLDELRRKGIQVGVFNGDKKSFLGFFQSYLDRIINQGTKLKYTNLYNLIKGYNSEVYGDVDVKFKDITIDFIEGFRKYLREKKKNSINSTNYKLKSLNSILKKGTIECQYLYQVYPFQNIKLKFQDKKVEVLSPEEMTRIFTTQLKEVYRSDNRFGEIITDKNVLKDPRYVHDNSLNDIRRYFIFQFLCQGIRSSDIITLRWNNIQIRGSEIRLKKTMIKTKHEIDILVNYSLIEILVHYIPKDKKYNFLELIKILSNINQIRRESGLYYEDNTMKKREDIEVEIEDIKTSWEKHKLSVRTIHGIELGVKKGGSNRFVTNLNKINYLIKTEEQKLENQLKHQPDFDVVESKYINRETLRSEKVIYLENLKTHIEDILDTRFKTLDNNLEFYHNQLYSTFSETVRYIQGDKDFRNRFVFKFLKDSDFIDIDDKNDFGVMTKFQYNRFTGSRTYYNRLLKVVMKQCGIEKNVSSHTSRHTYTSIMLELGDNLNLHDLMTSLGHKHLSTTQTYLHRFNQSKVDDLNRKLSDRFGKGF